MRINAAGLAPAASLPSTVSFGQKLSVNYNHDQSFAQYRTYAWASNNPNHIKNSILEQVAQHDIDSALLSMGLQKVDENQNPDLIVTSNGEMHDQTSYSAWGMRGIGGGMGAITPEQNVAGTIIVNLYDAKNQSLIWRGQEMVERLDRTCLSTGEVIDHAGGTALFLNCLG